MGNGEEAAFTTLTAGRGGALDLFPSFIAARAVFFAFIILYFFAFAQSEASAPFQCYPMRSIPLA